MDEFFPFTILKHRFSFYFWKDTKWCSGGDWQSLSCFHLSGSRTLIFPLLNKDKLYMFLTFILLSLWLFICLTFLFLFWPIVYQIALSVFLVLPFILEQICISDESPLTWTSKDIFKRWWSRNQIYYMVANKVKGEGIDRVSSNLLL